MRGKWILFLFLGALQTGQGAPVVTALTVAEKNAANARWELGQYLFQQREYPAALSELTKVSRLLPADAHLQSLIGTLQILTGSFEAGESTLLEAWRRNPNDAQIGLLLGEYYLSVQSHSKGFFFWEHALALDPDNHALRHALVRAYAESGHFDRAAPHVRLSLQFHDGKSPPDMDYAYGLYLADAGRWKESREHLERACAMPGSQPREQHHLGLARLRMGDHAAAAEALGRFAATGKAVPETFLAWGEALYLSKYWEEAEGAWLLGLKSHPRSFLLMNKLLEHYLRTARPERAVKVLDFARRKAGDDPRVKLLQARHSRLLGKNALAASELKRLLREAQGELWNDVLWESALVDYSRGHRKQAAAKAEKLMGQGYKAHEAHPLIGRLEAWDGNVPARVAGY